jgi:uncharacterized membrane protein YeiB
VDGLDVAARLAATGRRAPRDRNVDDRDDRAAPADLLRRDGSWIEWLHVSKYPPSLAYAGLELGIAFALLAAVWRWARPWKPLVVLGQTALLYYLIHAHVLKGGAYLLGIYRTEGIGATLAGWLVMPVMLYPVCRWYLAVKRRHPASVLRFL